MIQYADSARVYGQARQCFREKPPQRPDIRTLFRKANTFITSVYHVMGHEDILQILQIQAQ